MKTVLKNGRAYYKKFNTVTCFKEEDFYTIDKEEGPVIYPLFTLRLPTEEEADMVMEDLKENG